MPSERTADPSGPHQAGVSAPAAGEAAVAASGDLGPAKTVPVSRSAGAGVAGLRPLVLAGLMAGLTAVLSYLRTPLPFTPVPITGQTLGVMLSGLLLGPRWGFAAQLAYLLLGLAGAPVFAGGSAGPAPLLGPTGGFLLSYPLAAGLTGLLVRPGTWRLPKGRPGPAVAGRPGGGDRPAAPSPDGEAGFLRALLAAVTGGILLVYAAGAPWLAVVTGTAWSKIWGAAVLPFIPGDLAKAVLAAWLSRRLRRALGGLPA